MMCCKQLDDEDDGEDDDDEDYARDVSASLLIECEIRQDEMRIDKMR